MNDGIDMTPETLSEDDRRPLLIIAVGRQRVGKTTVLNATIQFLRAHGAEVDVWNGDRQNQSYNLAMFHPDTIEPPSSDAGDVRTWLEERMQSLVERRRDAILDIGGGDTPLNRLMEEVPIVEMLEEAGVRVVVVHVVGPEKADLDYLGHLSTSKLLAPEATLIVLNQGLVTAGRNVTSAFEPIRAAATIRQALFDGAAVAPFPLLSCMGAVVEAGLTFGEAMSPAPVPGKQALSMFDRTRVKLWWRDGLPRFFAAVPPLWLPAMHARPDAEAEAAPSAGPQRAERPGRRQHPRAAQPGAAEG